MSYNQEKGYHFMADINTLHKGRGENESILIRQERGENGKKFGDSLRPAALHTIKILKPFRKTVYYYCGLCFTQEYIQ